jgi:hypothetical protein
MADQIPPFITFEEREQEDRQATIDAGRPINKVVDFVIIQQSGSHDTTEKPAAEWLKQIEEYSSRHGATAAAYPLEWIEAFKTKYKKWKDGQELPEDGTPVRTCPIFNKGEIAAIENANIRTLEALAVASGEGLANIGMGGLALRQRAEKYLADASGSGKIVAENEKLRVKVDQQDEMIEKLRRQIDALSAKMQDKPKRKALIDED